MSTRILVAALAILKLGSVSAADQRPNFLFILTDDQSPWTLSAYGNEVCETPNLDRLAAEGMILHDAHHMGSWSGAVCMPSRTMIMTGRTVWRIPGAKGPDLKQPREFRKEAGRAESARAVQSSRVRHVSHLQERKQLQRSQQPLRCQPRRHQSPGNRRKRKPVAWRSGDGVPRRA